MIKYGLISETDARTLEKTIDLIDGNEINILEVGLYGGDTGKGLKEYCQSIGKNCFITGIDNNKDGEELRFEYDRLIIGNSTEVYNQIEDNSQHLIFDDGDHSYIGVISDFFAYCDKVKVGGYMAFHDTGKHIKPFKDFQHGDEKNPDAYISVRKALDILQLIYSGLDEYDKWYMVFDEADKLNETGGITVFKRLY